MGGQSYQQPQQQPQIMPQQQDPLSGLLGLKGGQPQPGAQRQHNMRKDAPRSPLAPQPGIPLLPEPPRANPVMLNSSQVPKAQIMPQQPQIMPMESNYGRGSKAEGRMSRRAMLGRQFNSGNL
jgi:hypothetical protein